jgi:hypothetical protein
MSAKSVIFLVGLAFVATYINTLFSQEPGDQVVITAVRGNQPLEVDITLGESH